MDVAGAQTSYNQGYTEGEKDEVDQEGVSGEGNISQWESSQLSGIGLGEPSQPRGVGQDTAVFMIGVIPLEIVTVNSQCSMRTWETIGEEVRSWRRV